LTLVGADVPSGDSPDSVAVDSTGKYVYASNFNGTTISVYSINASTGALTSIGPDTVMPGSAV
jgi:6-phosphogluconolactonase (cycloisomerase 2 family)